MFQTFRMAWSTSPMGKESFVASHIASRNPHFLLFRLGNDQDQTRQLIRRVPISRMSDSPSGVDHRHYTNTAMKNFRSLIMSLLVAPGLLSLGCGNTAGAPSTADSGMAQQPVAMQDHSNNPYWSTTDTAKLNVSKEEWKSILSPELFNIAFNGGTERPFTGKYTDYKGDGTFVCAVCGHPLYDAGTEFHSGTGWPSFYQPLTPTSVDHRGDGSLGMERTEVVCPRCDAHLGHVFDDGPKPTGLRYCMNSVSLVLEK